MFLVNSHNRQVTATTSSSRGELSHHRRHTFSRSYGANLPSSLTRVLSRALGYSPRPPESVCSTNTRDTLRAAFLGSLGLPSARCKHRPHHLSALKNRLSLSGPGSSAYRLEHAYQWRAGLPFSVPARFSVSPSGAGILTCLPSPTPFGLGLGFD